MKLKCVIYITFMVKTEFCKHIIKLFTVRLKGTAPARFNDFNV